MVEVIADHGLKGDDHAQVVELLGEEKGVGVLTVRSEHLRTDRNDFSDHPFSLALRKCGPVALQLGNEASPLDVPQQRKHAAGGGEHHGSSWSERQSNEVLARDSQRSLAVGSDPHNAAPAM